MYGRGSHERLTDSGDWREKIVLTAHRYMLEDMRIGLSFLDLGRRACRRADAAGACFPCDRPARLRRGFHGDRAHAGRYGPGRSRRAGCRSCCAEGFSDARPAIACLGAGRMGRGIAVVFAYAGHRVKLVDFKPRERGCSESSQAEALAEIRDMLVNLATSACSIPPRSVPFSIAVASCRGEAPARSPPPPLSSKACRKCSSSSARRWRAPPARGPETDHRLDHLDHPGR